MFLDPQYYEAGNQLYKFKWTDADHIRLHDALAGKSNWVMSYDDHPFIRDLYKVLAYLMAMHYSLGTKPKEDERIASIPALGISDCLRSLTLVSAASVPRLRIWIKGYGPND